MTNCVCRDSVQATPAEAFYQQPHMGPYLFFDCAHGQHESHGGASLFNKVCARFLRPVAAFCCPQRGWSAHWLQLLAASSRALQCTANLRAKLTARASRLQ